MKSERRNWPLRIAVAAVVTAAVWLFLSSRPHSHQGKTLEPAIEKLKVTSQNQTMELDDWYQNAMMISEFGPAASNALPNLLLALNPTNHSVIQAHAIIALGRIRCQPDIVVPAVTPFLRSPDVALRQKAVFALAQFGTKSRPARDELVRSLSDPDYWTRFSASNVLKVIDAEEIPAPALNRRSRRPRRAGVGGCTGTAEPLPREGDTPVEAWPP